jgi:hypothetical protein
LRQQRTRIYTISNFLDALLLQVSKVSSLEFLNYHCWDLEGLQETTDTILPLKLFCVYDQHTSRQRRRLRESLFFHVWIIKNSNLEVLKIYETSRMCSWHDKKNYAHRVSTPNSMLEKRYKNLKKITE